MSDKSTFGHWLSALTLGLGEENEGESCCEFRVARKEAGLGGSHSAVQRMELTAQISVKSCHKLMAETLKLPNNK